jgi:hypothetical protein
MKRWYMCTQQVANGVNGLAQEHHELSLPGGNVLVAADFPGPGEMTAFEAMSGITPLGHVVMNKLLPTAVATALSTYGVLATDGLRDALAKVVAQTDLHQLTLGEF